MIPAAASLPPGSDHRAAAPRARGSDSGSGPAGFAGRLARGLVEARMAQRGLALGAALAVLALTSGSAEAVGTYLWIAALVGGGITLMGLPRALGWSAEALFRVGALALAAGLLAITVLTSVLPAEPARGEQFRFAVAIAALLAVALPHALALVWPRLALVAGPITATAWTTTTVFAGAALLLLGLTWPVWPALQGPAGGMTQFLILIGLWTGPLQVAMTLGLWLAAFLAWRFETRRGVGGAGWVLALRGALVRGGGLMVGGAVALLAVPGLEGAASRAAFGTPLEGLAPVAGALAGGLAALAAAGLFFALPGVLARGQLNGRLSSSAAGESAWLAAGCSVLAVMTVVAREVLQALVAVPGGDTDLAVSFGLSPGIVLTAALMVLAHASVRLALGRPAGDGQPAIPLWLVLSAGGPSAAALATAAQAARDWGAGPVTFLAPPAAAPRLRGPHLGLARQAGALADLFVRAAADAAAWQRALPGQDGLPVREAYATAPGAAALLAGLPPDARVLVLADGPLASGWGDALATLPPRSLRVAREERFIPPGAPYFFPDKEPDSWRLYDFADPAKREHLLTRFLADHRPRQADQRRILILHGEADRALAERLAGLLDGQSDSAGRRVLASTLAPPVSQGAPLGWSARTWGTLWAFFLRSVDQGEYGPLRRALLRAFVDLRAEDRATRLDLVVVEFGVPRAQAQRLGGPERWADRVLSLGPAAPPTDAALLFDPATYTARLTLPPPSALAAMLPIVAEEILNEAYAAPPRGAAPAAAPESGGTADEAAAPGATSEAARTAGEQPATAPPEGTPARPPDRVRIRIFISYAPETPSASVALKLHAALKTVLDPLDASVFVDETKLAATDDWGLSVRDAIKGATHFVALLGDDYWLSRQCRWELDLAVRRYQASGSPRLLFILAEAMSPEFLRIGPDGSGAQLADEESGLAALGPINFLGPHDAAARLVPLARSDDPRLGEQIGEIVERLARSLPSHPAEPPETAAAGRASTPSGRADATTLPTASPVPVFLSYVSPYAAYREPLEDALLARGLDVRSDRVLRPGELWREALARHLEESRILVVLAGPATATSEFASAEIDTALGRGLPIVPVIVAPFDAPAPLLERQAANRLFLADLGPQTLRAEIDRAADAIAGLAAALAVPAEPGPTQAPA